MDCPLTPQEQADRKVYFFLIGIFLTGGLVSLVVGLMGDNMGLAVVIPIAVILCSYRLWMEVPKAPRRLQNRNIGDEASDNSSW